MNLYEEINIENHNMLLSGDKNFMAYCPHCNKETTFKRSEWYDSNRKRIDIIQETHEEHEIQEAILNHMFCCYEYHQFIKNDNRKDGLFIQEYECCMNNKHKTYNIYIINDNKIIKIGQYPSDVDKSIILAKEIQNVCSNNEIKELRRYFKTALVMESYGYGIAGLLYLRRAFEKMIAISENKIKFNNIGMTMKERIKKNPLLPKEIKDNSRIYNVISEGIHNETEEECIDLFKIIKSGLIILIHKTYAYIEEQKELEKLLKINKKILKQDIE